MQNKQIRIIGVPMDLGASRRGVDMGPSAIRASQIGQKLRDLGHTVTDAGNVYVSVQESLEVGDARSKYLKEILATTRNLSQFTYDTMVAGDMPLILGGDHSIAMGSVAGISRFYHEQSKKIGIIWLDAHGDINTPETSLSGNIHGMPFAHILGHGTPELLSLSDYTPMVDPSRAVLIGARDLDPAEKAAIKKIGVKTFTMRDIDEFGLSNVMKEAIRIASNGTVGFHVSFDVDWIDPSFAPGVGTPVQGGATYREGHLAMEWIHDSGKMLSLEVTEVNPILDVSNQTAQLACGMICSAFGKRIL
jgi:arginase